MLFVALFTQLSPVFTFAVKTYSVSGNCSSIIETRQPLILTFVQLTPVLSTSAPRFILPFLSPSALQTGANIWAAKRSVSVAPRITWQLKRELRWVEKSETQRGEIHFGEIVVLSSRDWKLRKFEISSLDEYVAFSEDVFGGCCWGVFTLIHGQPPSLLFCMPLHSECLMHQILICHSFILDSSFILWVMWLTGEMCCTSAVSAEICYLGLKWAFEFDFPSLCIINSDKLI